MLDRGGDRRPPSSPRPRRATAARLPRRRARAASAAARSSARDPGPGHVVIEQPGQLPGEPARAPVRRRPRPASPARVASPSTRPLERRVLGEDPLPGARGRGRRCRRAVSPAASARRRRTGATAAPGGRRAAAGRSRPAGAGTPRAAGPRRPGPGPDALNQTVAAIGRDAHRRRPRPDVRLLDRPGHAAARAPPSVASIQASASARHAGSSQVRRPGRDQRLSAPPPNSVPKTPRMMSWPSREVTTLPPVRMAVSIVFCCALAASRSAFSCGLALALGGPLGGGHLLRLAGDLALLLGRRHRVHPGRRRRWHPAAPRHAAAWAAAAFAAAIRAVIRS